MIKIGGFQPFSLSDYPGYISCIVFTQGCNFRCKYCHNPSLVLPELFGNLIPEADVLAFLEGRKGDLDGVVITGGEPTIQAELPEFIGKVKALGFKVKLDTNGSNPRMIQELIKLGLIDYCAMDIKTSWERYPDVVGVDVDIESLKQSLLIILASGIPCEFRTTHDGSLVTETDLRTIRGYLPDDSMLKIQPCRKKVTLESVVQLRAVG